MGIEGIGARVTRKEDKRFITGAGRFVDDMVVPGMKHAAFVRSPYAHAEIKKIDVKKAQGMPGVIGVLTGKELKADGIGNLICGWMIHSHDGSPMKMGAWSPLAVDRVRYVGDAVVIVVAETKGQARDAAEAVDITYKEKKAVVDAVAALKPGAPQVHPEADNNLIFDWGLGDAAATDAAIKKAAHVTKMHIVNNRLVPNAIEPRAALAHYDKAEDHYTCWTTSQNPHLARLVMSAFYNVAPENKLRVIAPDVGGAFGSKIYIYPEEIVCCWASKKTGVPVKWVADRTESFLTDAHGRDHVSEVQMAFDKDNRIIGLKVDTIANLGAYMSLFSSAYRHTFMLPCYRASTTSRRSTPTSARSTPTPLRSTPIAGQGGLKPPILVERDDRDCGSRTPRLAGRTAPQELHHQLPAPDARHHEL